MDKHGVELFDRTFIPIRAFSTIKPSIYCSTAEVKQAVKDAIDIGYRHFDCAHAYGTQIAVGQAIKEKIQAGVVKREHLFITSKLWCTHHRPDLVRPALLKTLKDLQLEYIDLYIIHWPHALKEGTELFPMEPGTNEHAASNVDYLDTWDVMIDLKPKARRIGVGNFNSYQIQRILERTLGVFVLPAIELHPFLNQRRLRQFCTSQSIVVMAHSPLAKPAWFWKDAQILDCLDDLKISVIAFRYGRTRAQILIRYSTQLGNVVVIQAVKKHRIAENFQIFDFTLTERDMRDLSSLECAARLYTMPESRNNPHYPFKGDVDF